jgi:hypothetical protein
MEQVWGPEARDNLARMALDQDVEVEPRGSAGDVLVATIRVGGVDLANAMLESGLAWLSGSNESSDEYAVTLFVARAGSKGMWADGEESLVHPARWREARLAELRPTPAPTPTPRPPTLSDIASSIELGGDDEEEVTIEGIPPKEVRDRETRTLDWTLRSLVYMAQRIKRLEHEREATCTSNVRREVESSGSYWSDSEGRWIRLSESSYDRRCSSIDTDLESLRYKLRRDKAAAVNRARLYRIRQEVINRIVQKHGLEMY